MCNLKHSLFFYNCIFYELLQILEYVEDLRYYWNDGYAHDLTYKQACPALVDMFKFFE